MSKNNGEPAFPLPHGSETTSGSEGMTLRDYFAAKAMQGMVAAEYGHCVRAQTWAKDAYELADAMLKAREVVA